MIEATAFNVEHGLTSALEEKIYVATLMSVDRSTELDRAGIVVMFARTKYGKL
jgi:hypothetical protein